MPAQAATFTDVRIVGRIEAVLPGDQGERYRVAAEARSGTTLIHTVIVTGSRTAAAEGDMVRIMGELGAEGIIVVPAAFGEFLVLARAAPSQTVEREAPAATAAPKAAPASPPAARPVGAVARPSAFGGFGRPGMARPAPSAQAGATAAPQASAPSPANTAPRPATAQGSSTSASTVARPAFRSRGSMMTAGRMAGGATAPSETGSRGSTPAHPPAAAGARGRNRGGMMSTAMAPAEDEPPLHGEETTQTAASSSQRMLPEADPVRKPPAQPDETDMEIPW